jgi:ribosomal protein S18 acetylase RimI-like enzyme
LPVAKFALREAKKEDLDQILSLWQNLAELYAHLNPSGFPYKETVFQTKRKEFARALLDRENYLLLVAEAAQQIIGYIRVAIIKKPETILKGYERVGEIESFFVAKEWRDKGIGRQLFTKSIDWFKKKAVKHIFVKVMVQNKEAIAMYKHLGFHLRNYVLEMDL